MNTFVSAQDTHTESESPTFIVYVHTQALHYQVTAGSLFGFLIKTPKDLNESRSRATVDATNTVS